jgi:plastocyanin
MNAIRVTFAAGLAVIALAAVGCGGGDEGTGDTGTTTTETTATETSPSTALQGSVGPGFEISLTENGQAVTSLTAGSYTIDVNDQSDIHNFHLTGPGVDKMTEVGQVETETFEVELQPGTYSFVCDPHASSMNGSFEVTG